MIFAASVFRLPRYPWIPLSGLSAHEASTNYRFQFFAIRKKKWFVLGVCLMPKKEAGLPRRQLFYSGAIAASERACSKESPPACALPICWSFSAPILFLQILLMACLPIHSASASLFHRWWTGAAPFRTPSLGFNILMIRCCATT